MRVKTVPTTTTTTRNGNDFKITTKVIDRVDTIECLPYQINIQVTVNFAN